MKLRILRRCSQLFPILLVVFSAGWHVSAAPQEKPRTRPPSAQNTQLKPIDIDRELEVKLPQNRALSYYHYALARWYEGNNDLQSALSAMRRAVKYNENSSEVHIEYATLLMEKVEDVQGAMTEAQEAARLDPSNPEPHWLLANVYFKSQGPTADSQLIRKAIIELELMRDKAPQDQRAYFALGTAYMQIGEDEKGIQAFEKFQALVPETNAGYLEIARIYQRKGNAEKAEEFLKKAVEIDPNHLQALMNLAEIQRTKLNKIKDSIDTYKKVLALTGDNPQVKRELASSLVDAGEFAEASKILEELTKEAPDDKEMQVLLGRARIETKHFTEAIQLLKSVHDENPDSIEAEFYLGTAYEQSGQAQEAAKIFQDLVAKSDGSAELRENRKVFQAHLAAAYNDSGEPDKAVAVYEQMVKEEAPPKPQTLFQLINAYRLNRQFDKALPLAKQEFEKNGGKSSEIGLVYARTLADAGKTKEGAEILTRMLQSDPTNVDVCVNLSQVYLQGEKYSEAEKVLRRAAEKDVEDADRERLKFQLASVYERQKEYDRAESLFKELLKENPRNANVLNYIGYMLADRGVRLDEAVKYVREALEVEPNNPAYLDSLGWAFYKLNDLPQAEQYLLRAVSMTKNDPVMYDHLGDVYYKTGDYQKALDFWTRSVQNGTEPKETQKVREKLEKLQETLRKQKPY